MRSVATLERHQTSIVCQKRPIIEAKETYYIGVKRDQTSGQWLLWGDIKHQLRVKRDLLHWCQQRPIIEAKETYGMRHQVSGRFGETSIVCQKRPIIEAKETYDMRHQVSGRFGET
jgi:hypothetical protein